MKKMEHFSFPINSKYKKRSNSILISEKFLKIILDFLNNLEWNRFFYFEMNYKKYFQEKNELFLLTQKFIYQFFILNLKIDNFIILKNFNSSICPQIF